MIKSNVIREDGSYHSFCGLACVGWLYQKIKDSFFLILGTHTCAHFLQNAMGVMIFARPRFAVALLEEEDLSKQQPELDTLIDEILADHKPSVIFLLSSCTPEVMKVEFEGLANAVSRPNLPVLFVPASGLDYTFSQAEDSVLQALTPHCPTTTEKNVVFLGSVNDVIENDFRREAEKLGIPVGGFLPSSRFDNLPAIGENTILAPIQPYLAKATLRLKRERGATALSSQFPFGPDGTRRFWEDLAAEFGIDVDLSQREADAWAKLQEDTDLLKGKTAFFTADNLLELPLARFLQSAGCEIVECSSTYINRKFHKHELAALDDAGARVVEQPNFDRQLQDIAELQPDIVISNMATTNPLVGSGVVAKWSTEFAFMPIHGWAGASTLIGMFTKSIKRHAQLDQFDDPVWTAGIMPGVIPVDAIGG